MTEFDFGNGPVEAHKHPNGGGWVADSATVDPTAYVGPGAEIGPGEYISTGAEEELAAKRMDAAPLSEYRGADSDSRYLYTYDDVLEARETGRAEGYDAGRGESQPERADLARHLEASRSALAEKLEQLAAAENDAARLRSTLAREEDECRRETERRKAAERQLDAERRAAEALDAALRAWLHQRGNKQWRAASASGSATPSAGSRSSRSRKIPRWEK